MSSYYFRMIHSGFSDTAPTPEAVVDPETLAGLQMVMNRMLGIKPVRRTPQFPNGSVASVSYDEGNVRIDWDSPKPNAAGSGQLLDKEQDTEFVVWLPLEGVPLSTAHINGKVVTPYGFVHEMTTDPSDPSGESSLSRMVIPTREGIVFEVNEGVFMSDDYLAGHTQIRELGDGEVGSLVTNLSATHELLSR